MTGGRMRPVLEQVQMRNKATPLWLFLATFIVYSLYFLITMLRPTFYITGDEVYYLTMAYSLWEDGDLDLSDEYADKSYRQFYPQILTENDIDEHHLTGRQGELYSRHGLGLPLLILPAWALGKQVGVSLWLTALTAILGVQLLGLVRDLIPDSKQASWWGWIGIMISPPVTLYASLLFAELPAALALTLILRYGILRKGPVQSHHSALVLTSMLALPWLNPRYVLLVMPLVVALWIRQRRWTAFVGAIGNLLPYIHFWILLGFIPTLGDYGHIMLRVFPSGFFGLWIDREAGLISYGPIYLLALFGLVRCGMRPRAAVWRWWNLLWLPYFLFMSFYDYWFGGWNPPARMMIPVIPFLAPLVVLALSEMKPKIRRVTAGLLSASGLITSGLLLTSPLLRYNSYQGQSRLFETIFTQTGINLNNLLPGLIHLSPSGLWQIGLIIPSLAIGYLILFPLRSPRTKT